MILRMMFSTLFAVCLCVTAPGSQDVEHTHNDLRALRDDMVDAVNHGDVNRLLSHLTDAVVVTFEDAEVARGREGVRAYLERMTKGPNAIVAAYQTSVTVDELTTLYGDDTGVATGSSDDHFTLSSGTTFALAGRWTATLVRQDGTWYVAAFHASTSMFDNPILTKMKTTVYIVGLFGFVMGIVVGIGAMMLGRKRGKA